MVRPLILAFFRIQANTLALGLSSYLTSLLRNPHNTPLKKSLNETNRTILGHPMNHVSLRLTGVMFKARPRSGFLLVQDSILVYAQRSKIEKCGHEFL